MGEVPKKRNYHKRTNKTEILKAKRGTIYDSTGAKILAQSISTNIVTAVPNNIPADKRDEVAQKLADVLGINKDEAAFLKNDISFSILS